LFLNKFFRLSGITGLLPSSLAMFHSAPFVGCALVAFGLHVVSSGVVSGRWGAFGALRMMQENLPMPEPLVFLDFLFTFFCFNKIVFFCCSKKNTLKKCPRRSDAFHGLAA